MKNLEKLYRAGCISLGTLLVCLLIFPPSSVAIMDYWACLTCICSFAFISLWGMTVNNEKTSVLSQTTLRLRRDFTAQQLQQLKPYQTGIPTKQRQFCLSNVTKVITALFIMKYVNVWCDQMMELFSLEINIFTVLCGFCYQL